MSSNTGWRPTAENKEPTGLAEALAALRAEREKAHTPEKAPEPKPAGAPKAAAKPKAPAPKQAPKPKAL